MLEDEIFMARCIQLAKNGQKNSQPNPMVGAVVVYNGRIIGEGYHIRCGEGHAEVNALASVKEIDRKYLCESTIYVSLEPCAHYGKTPPCADLIVRNGLKRVVIGCVDPFAKVKGKGIEKIQNAGIDVTVGVLEKECMELNKRFMTFHSNKRPFVTLKWAETSDGYIGNMCDCNSVAISNEYTKMLCHKRRTEHQAIMVGRNTAQHDNPSLTVREWDGKSPKRVIVDRNATLPPTLRVYDGSVPTIVFHDKTVENIPDLCGIQFIAIDFSTDIIPQMMTILHENGIQSLLVEGGSMLLQSFINSGLWDEAFVERSNKTLLQCAGTKDKSVRAPLISNAILKDTQNFFGRNIECFVRCK